MEGALASEDMAGIDKELLELIGRGDNPAPPDQKPVKEEDDDGLPPMPPPPPSEPHPDDIKKEEGAYDPSSEATEPPPPPPHESWESKPDYRELSLSNGSQWKNTGPTGDIPADGERRKGGSDGRGEMLDGREKDQEVKNEMVSPGYDRGSGDAQDGDTGHTMEAGEIVRSDAEVEEGEAADSDDDGGDEDDAPVIELREDLVYDEEDRAKLLGMTEVDREMVYAERIERREREKIRQRLLHGGREEPGNEDEHRPGVRREKDNRNRKDYALRELQKRTAEQEQRKFSTWDTRDGSDEGEDMDHDRSGGDSDDAGSAEISESESDNERGRRGNQDTYGRHGEIEVMEEEFADSKDIASIQVFRSQLERWISEPHFEATVPQCFVRMAEAENNSGTVQRGYRIMEIMECVQREHKPYKYGERGGIATKYLRLREGYKEHIREIIMVSNKPFLPNEFERWRQCCERDNRTPLSKQSTAETQAKISKAGKYTYSAEDVKTIVQKKKETKKRPIVDIVAERLRLERKRDFHQEKHDLAEVDKLNQQIEELTQVKQLARTSRGRRDGMADVNRRNMRANLETSLNKGTLQVDDGNVLDEGLDPFQRRATRPPKYWKTGVTADGASKVQVEQAAKKRKPTTETPIPAKLHRIQEEFVEGIRALDMPLDLKVTIPTPIELLVSDILPTAVSFSDAQQELEASVQDGSKRSLTLRDYKGLF